jgi:hypothetical protein
VQDAYLGRELNPSSPLPPYFSSTTVLRRQHDGARQKAATVHRELRAGRWRLEVRTGCPVEYGGSVVVEGRALLRDQDGRVRAYAEASGTGDSAGVWKLYYDEVSRLRVVTFTWRNYMGQTADVVAQLDEVGRLETCSAPAGGGDWVCGMEEDRVTGLDRDVIEAVRPRQRKPAADQGPISWALDFDPVTLFADCQTPYHPQR